MPGASGGINRALLEGAQTSLRQVSALFAAGIQRQYGTHGCDVTELIIELAASTQSSRFGLWT